MTAYQAGRLDEVHALSNRILEHNAGHVGALHLQGLLALASGHAETARSWLERAIQIHPAPIFYNTLYAIQLKLGDFAGAIDSLRQGLAIDPDFAALHYNLALTLQHHDCLDEAAVSYRRTLELDPDNSAAHNNLGRILGDLGALDEAERHYRRALEVTPANLIARNNLAMVLLATGRYEAAWPYFEDRWISFRRADGTPAREPVQVPLPRWTGADLRHGIGRRAGRVPYERLLVLDEQGYGDSLQFVRYLPLLLRCFPLVGYVCPPALRRLYEQSLCSRWPGIRLLDAVPAELNDWDCYCPLMSLPMAFHTQVETIPAELPYLHADPKQAAIWRARLAALPTRYLPRVGVVWAGGHSGIAVDRLRSLTFAQIAPLLAPAHIHWISLQKTDDPSKRANSTGTACADPNTNSTPLTDWTADLADFADTAALIANLDLVISVDTSVAHLAAAMDKPVWLLNRFAGCWRWLQGRDDSPWYPGLRLFTQPRRGDWDDVLTRVARALQQRFPHAGTPLQSPR
ncbi:tetratricopeptide repeat protein [Paraburkholderia sp. BL21I4N1]|uniref:tetratricopeptide repeat-containing glycosyltransferase family protein n=1 Tax=Paraburkholderia sp. BL21I4N1 TaxID=1938801 RepID=UPI002157689B|nr:tetratricopeptide repeat-containing glycosyltransferase family protein [Paraburkholderia sp. BL21I4N1]